MCEHEIRKAIDGLATHKTPGPDDFPAELYKQLPIIVSALQRLFDVMLETGKLPKMITRIYVVPLLKAGKNPSRCDSRRPISPISTVIKILEAVLYRRILPGVESALSSRQYAYRRDRGREVNRGKFVSMDRAHGLHPPFAKSGEVCICSLV